MTKLKIPKNIQKMALVPLSEYLELIEFKSKMEIENSVFINEGKGIFSRHTYYTTSDMHQKLLLEELKVCKALEQDLEFENTILVNKIEDLESMTFFQFIKQRYFTKKSKQMK